MLTILVDWQIDKLIRKSNLITPYDPSHLNPASLDVLLGDKILIECPLWRQPLKAWSLLMRGVLLDNFWNILNGDTPRYLLIDINQKYYVSPNEFFLASTKEVFNLPDDISCEFRLKSSRAREGWGHALAVWIDPGFNNSVLTLELKNYTRFKKLHLFSGMKIGQIIFHEHEYCDKSYRETGRYNGDLTVQNSKG